MPAGLDSRFLAAVIQSVGHPIFVKDREFRFVLVNDALCAALGYDQGDFVGRTDFDLFPEAEARFFRQKDEELFRSEGAVVIEEETVTDASGVVHVLATTKVPLRRADGEVSHLVGIIQDITDLKVAEDGLRAANEELELRVAERTRQLHEAQAELLRKERLAVLGQLAGGVAHQLRNPLGALINAASILRRSALQATDLEVIEIIEAESWRANRIVEDLLSYARIRSPAVQELSLLDLVRSVVLGVQTERTSVALVGAPEVVIRVDPSQVAEALRNLVMNAVEAAGEGGSVEVRAAASEGRATIAIVDDGPGIDESDRRHLFEPLFTTKAYGLGLGLTTARSLIENQGGQLRCAQTGPDGTVFEVELPTAGTGDEPRGV